jgi:hypothetical protein
MVGVVAQDHNPSHSGGRRPAHIETGGLVLWCTPVFSVIQGSTSRITVLASPGLKQDPTQKKKKKKKPTQKELAEWLK